MLNVRIGLRLAVAVAARLNPGVNSLLRQQQQLLTRQQGSVGAKDKVKPAGLAQWGLLRPTPLPAADSEKFPSVWSILVNKIQQQASTRLKSQVGEPTPPHPSRVGKCLQTNDFRLLCVFWNLNGGKENTFLGLS